MTRANIDVCVRLLLLFREPPVLSVDFLYELLPPSVILHAEAFFGNLMVRQAFVVGSVRSAICEGTIFTTHY